MQRVAILDFRETADHKWSRIACREVFDLRERIEKTCPLLVGGLIGILRRHVVRIDVRDGLHPLARKGRITRLFDGDTQIEPRLRPVAVTLDAVFGHELLDVLFEGLLSLGLPCGEFSVLDRMSGEGQRKGEETADEDFGGQSRLIV